MAQQRFFDHWPGVLQEPSLKRQWSAAFMAGVLALFPLLISIDLYIDDIERAMQGSFDWVRVGRPLADALVESLNFGRPATAVAPLYTLVAIAVLSVVGVACARAYGIRSPFWTAIAAVPLMAQPYALQAMSYGFDSLFMASSLAFAISAALLVHRGSGWRAFLAAFGLQLLSFNLYQPGANGFLVMTGCLCVASALDLLARPTSAFSLRLRLLISALIYAGGYGFYRLLISLFFEQQLNGYAVNSATLMPLDAALPSTVLSFALEPFEQLFEDFGHWPVLLPFLVLALSYAVVLIQWRSWNVALLAIAALLVVLLVAPGGMLFLRESFVRHPRVLVYYGPFATSLVLQLLVMSRRLHRPFWNFGILPMIWLMVVFSYAYGHAFSAQVEFEQVRISRIVAAASSLQASASDQPFRSVAVKGTMPRSPVMQNTVRKFPLIDRLIPPLLDGNKTFSVTQLRHHGLGLTERRPKELKDSFPAVCVPSADAICGGEFSLYKVDQHDLLLQLNTPVTPRRSRT